MEDAFVVDPDPDPAIQGLFWAEVGLPDCHGWVWGFVEEEGGFELKEDPDGPARTHGDIKVKR